MDEAVTKQHAHPSTVYHCLYAYYHLKYSRKELARVFSKTERTIGRWIERYETNGSFERSTADHAPRTFTEAQREWMLQFYQKHPLAYLDEAQMAFKRQFTVSISISSVWRMVHGLGLTRRVLERRAMHVKEQDIFRFAEELSQIDWSHKNLVFLDEVSFDNRGMIRRRGYALRGKNVAFRGEFERKPRVSILAFIGVDGIIDYFDIEGTFDRAEFVQCCETFISSPRSAIRLYPGRNSVWILDGATIHRHPGIVHYVRSRGVVPIFLPAYCPFYNPIEIMFGFIKRAFQRSYTEGMPRDLMRFVIETFRKFERYDMHRVFEHCGWSQQGFFDPAGPLSREISTSSRTNDPLQDDLDFVELESE